MNASSQRLELIARMFAETGVKELFRHMIKMNQMFITEQTFIRVTDERKPIMPDDLEGSIDITVNVGVVAGSKQQQAQSMQLLLSMYPQLLQAGVADLSHVAEAFGRLVEALGYKDVSNFIFPPELIRQAEMMGIPPLQLLMVQQAQQTGQAPPALQQAAQGQMTNTMQQATQNAGIYQRQQEIPPPQPQEDNTNLSTQEYIQRIAPQPNSTDEDRRDGVF